MTPPPRAHGKALAWLLGGIFLAVYVRRLCPTLSLVGDSAELVTAAALWGVPHPPGYPLYTLIGHAFAALPTHTLPWRVHLTSALFHSGALVAVCAAAFTVTGSRLAAVVAACALGMSRSFLLGSLYAEVFPLNDLFFACLLALGLRISANTEEAKGAPLVFFAFLAGLASTHHMMVALAAPALAILVSPALAAFWRGRPWRGAALVLAYLCPVLVYALVPWAASRSPALSWGEVHDSSSLFRLMTRQDYGGLFSPTRAPSPESAFRRLSAFAGLVLSSMGALSIGLAGAGLTDQLRRQPRVGTSLALGILVPGPLFACANALGTGSEETLAYFERFTTMCQVPLAITVAAGVAAVRTRVGTHRDLVIWVGGAILAMWAISAASRTRDVDLRADWRGLAFAHDLVLPSPDRSLILLSGDAPGSAALYVCAVEKVCEQRIVLSPGSLFLPWKMAQVRKRYPGLVIPWSGGPALRKTHELAAAAITSRPVLAYPDLLEKDSSLAAAFAIYPDHLLYRLWPPDAPVSDEQTAFLTSARAMVTGEGCEGCRLVERIVPRPSQDVQLAKAYEAAFINHARTARSVADGGDLAVQNEARARQMAALRTTHGGDESMSR